MFDKNARSVIRLIQLNLDITVYITNKLPHEIENICILHLKCEKLCSNYVFLQAQKKGRAVFRLHKMSLLSSLAVLCQKFISFGTVP